MGRKYVIGRPNQECIVTNPSRNSIKLGDKYVCLRAIARVQGVTAMSISLILAGNRTPSLRLAQAIASSIGMGLEEFLEAVEQRKAQRIARKLEIVQMYQDRVIKENLSDNQRRRKGKPVVPRIPALRLPK